MHETSDQNNVFPGENWFYYWKTSRSLWKSKLAEKVSCGRVIIPINWALHSENGQNIDFGDIKPETDLVALYEIGQELGLQLSFYLPLGPSPFLINGGVPQQIARKKSVDKDGFQLVFTDPEGRLNRMHSFFDNRVFQAYSRFVGCLGTLFSTKGINSDIWSVECGRLSDSKFESFFEDYSQTFEEAFSKYLAAHNENGEGEFSNEYIARKDFYYTIYNFYLGTIKKKLSPNWEGILQLNFISSSRENLLTDMPLESSLLVDEVIAGTTRGILPSTTLLEKKPSLDLFYSFVDDYAAQSFSRRSMEENLFDSNQDYPFPCDLVELYVDSDPVVENDVNFQLLNILQNKLSSCFQIKNDLDLSKVSIDEVPEDKLYIVALNELDESELRDSLKILLGGGNIAIAKDSLSREALAALESFLFENSIKLEKVQYVSSLEMASVGEGSLILFNSSELFQAKYSQRTDFWLKVLDLFNIKNISLDISEKEGIKYYWQKRSPSSFELNYEEVRRVTLYNFGKTKEKFNLSFDKSFALIAILNEVNALARSKPGSVEVEIKPSGKITLEFGVVS